MRLTGPQLKALDWLPGDGSWKLNPGRLSGALNSLSLAAGSRLCRLCECEWGDFGPRGGRCQRWRLTEAGIAEKASRQTAA